ncbi:MAG TPA: glycerophosphodiester phosphodiesterase family protein [bacterium]|nr:glycerophosphodiester phosphodiesterase family protein [bacterium]
MDMSIRNFTTRIRYRTFFILLAVFLAADSFAATTFFQPVDPPRKTQVMVHRGLMCAAPENTLPAFQAAIEAGFEWVETDIRLTRDGHYVLLHNDVVDGITDGSGKVEEMLLADLKKLDAGVRFAPSFKGTRVPTLREALEFCKGKINLYLDCKGRIDPETLVEEIQATGMESQVIVFDDPDVLKEVKRISKGGVPIMPSINDRLEVKYWMDSLSPQAVEVHAELLTPELVRGFHEVGVIVQAQTLGERDCPEVWRRCFEMGVDWIQTDLGEEVLAEYVLFHTGAHFPVKISSHRGANEFAPENTLPAYEKAAKLGVDFVEIDVHTTQDGEQVSIHDHTLERTTNGTGAVSDIRFEDLRKLSAGAWFGAAYADQKVPTIDEICELLNEFETKTGRAVELYVDCKAPNLEKLADILRKHRKLSGAVFYGSPDGLLLLRKYAPEAKLMPPMGSPSDLEPRAEKVKPYALDTRWSILSQELISNAHKKNIRIYSDAMGDNETIERYREAIHWGIDTIQTDCIPRVLRAIELELLY